MAFCGNCGAETAENGVCPNCGPVAEQVAEVNQPVQYEEQPQQQQQPQQPYVAPGGPPADQLKTNRSLLKYILLSIVTFGIYSIVFYYGVSSDINVTASRYDGKKTMNYALLLFLIAPLTMGIAALVWNHKLFSRMGEELKRRNLSAQLSATDFWLWGVVGSIIIVGPFIALHKLATASNQINESYNMYG